MSFLFTSGGITGGPRAPREHATPIRTYAATIHGQAVTVKVYAPGASGGRARMREDIAERAVQMKERLAEEYTPSFQLWNDGES